MEPNNLTVEERTLLVIIAAQGEAGAFLGYETVNENEHGVDGAVYRREITGKTPTIFCLCGFEASGETWALAGAALDAHHEASRT